MREILLGLVMLSLCFLMRPRRVTCPPNHWAEGVRPDGSSRCIRDLPGGPSCVGASSCVDDRETQSFPIQIYCTNGTQPIAAYDGRTIGCQRR